MSSNKQQKFTIFRTPQEVARDEDNAYLADILAHTKEQNKITERRRMEREERRQQAEYEVEESKTRKSQDFAKEEMDSSESSCDFTSPSRSSSPVEQKKCEVKLPEPPQEPPVGEPQQHQQDEQTESMDSELLELLKLQEDLKARLRREERKESESQRSNNYSSRNHAYQVHREDDKNHMGSGVYNNGLFKKREVDREDYKNRVSYRNRKNYRRNKDHGYKNREYNDYDVKRNMPRRESPPRDGRQHHPILPTHDEQDASCSTFTNRRQLRSPIKYNDYDVKRRMGQRESPLRDGRQHQPILPTHQQDASCSTFTDRKQRRSPIVYNDYDVKRRRRESPLRERPQHQPILPTHQQDASCSTFTDRKQRRSPIVYNDYDVKRHRRESPLRERPQHQPILPTHQQDASCSTFTSRRQLCTPLEYNDYDVKRRMDRRESPLRDGRQHQPILPTHQQDASCSTFTNRRQLRSPVKYNNYDVKRRMPRRESPLREHQQHLHAASSNEHLPTYIKESREIDANRQRVIKVPVRSQLLWQLSGISGKMTKLRGSDIIPIDDTLLMSTRVVVIADSNAKSVRRIPVGWELIAIGGLNMQRAGNIARRISKRSMPILLHVIFAVGINDRDNWNANVRDCVDMVQSAGVQVHFQEIPIPPLNSVTHGAYGGINRINAQASSIVGPRMIPLPDDVLFQNPTSIHYVQNTVDAFVCGWMDAPSQ